MTESDPKYSADNKVRMPAVEEEIRNAYAARNYPLAHVAFDDWWKIAHLESADTAFLSLLGDLCNRVGDIARGDLIEERLAEHGTPVQCARALRILNRRWFGTPKQVRLSDLYRHAVDRYPELKDDQEVEALGQRLNSFS
jgi:hypothetical protein